MRERDRDEPGLSAGRTGRAGSASGRALRAAASGGDVPGGARGAGPEPGGPATPGTAPVKTPARESATAFAPPYHVVLHNDDDHTFEYVIEMLRAIFGFPREKGHRHAKEVDAHGRSILITTTREHAELKQEQIHAFGPDPRLPRCAGSMTATVEPAF